MTDHTGDFGMPLRRRLAWRFWSFTEAPKDPPQWARFLVLAQCDSGDFWLPSLNRADWWDRRYNPRNPAHWPYALLSRLTGWLVFIEAET